MLTHRQWRSKPSSGSAQGPDLNGRLPPAGRDTSARREGGRASPCLAFPRSRVGLVFPDSMAPTDPLFVQLRPSEDVSTYTSGNSEDRRYSARVRYALASLSRPTSRFRDRASRCAPRGRKYFPHGSAGHGLSSIHCCQGKQSLQWSGFGRPVPVRLCHKCSPGGLSRVSTSTPAGW